MAHDLIQRANRSTPIVVSAGAKTPPAKKGEGPVVRRYRANAREEAIIRKGGWVPGRGNRRSKIRPALYRKKR